MVVAPAALGCSLALLYLLVRAAPGERGLLYFPSSLEDIKNLAEVLGEYNQLHPRYVLLLFTSAYLFKQTFAVPGSVFLNVLAGAIFGGGPAFLLCSALTALGASLCCLLARAAGEGAVAALFPRQLAGLRARLEGAPHLALLLTSLRLFPCSPNWALNMASGVLGVPLHLFFITVGWGCRCRCRCNVGGGGGAGAGGGCRCGCRSCVHRCWWA